MPKKIFISYKYGDGDVRALPSGGLVGTTVRHYVDELQAHLDLHDYINKGEKDSESLAGFKDATIESKLRDKIYDSTVTVVLVSKNMKDPSLSEDEQWIPWEISYSLKETPRVDRVSRTNAVIAVIVPDRTGSYDYFMSTVCPSGCINMRTDTLFGILGKNMFNRKTPNTFSCMSHPTSITHIGNDHSYIYPIKWDAFISDVNGHVSMATQINERIDEYNLVKMP